MKVKGLAIPVVLLLAATTSLPALADELIRFKSGYEMMVVSHREERGMIIVTLDGGGEVGFAKEVLDLLEGGKATTRTGPSPLYNKVWSRVRVGKFLAPVPDQPSRFLAKGSTNANGVTIGYSKGGQGMQRFSGGPIGEVNPGGKIGTDIRTRGRIRNHNTGEDLEKGKERARTVEAALPGSREGE